MIGVNSVSVSFSGIDLFKEISFVINERDRIGLVGKNGVGKSTLMKIILGLQEPDSGSVSLPDGRSIGYLSQEMVFDGTKTVMAESLTAFAELNKLREREAEIQKELTEREDYESDSYAAIIDELGVIHQRLEIIDDGKEVMRCEQILLGLGFKRHDFDRKIGEFSGGWQMRVELAKLILKQPDLLLLDEPTNHLDIDSILWLESFFQDYPGAIMMISHDRMFLDNVTNRTIEIVAGKVYDYAVSYSKFEMLRGERVLQQQATFENQQKYIAQQERFIERFKAKSSKAKQAQSKMKQLDKLVKVSVDDLDKNAIKFRFPPAPRSGDVTVKAREVAKNYGDNHVMTHVDFDIFRGERVAFVGKNGQGKSTLVKMIVGDESGGGELKIGHNVDIGYYAQVQEKSLNPELTIENIIENEATGENAKIHKVRGLLGAFLFGADDFDKKVKVLSGGEKSRLALAKLLLRECNLLILDEPTNHLDMSAKAVLKQALKDYNGTLIVVSHDREFLQGLTDRTFEFAGGRVKEHIGGIDEFLAQYQFTNFRDLEGQKDEPAKKKQEQQAKPNPKQDEPAAENASEKKQLSYQERKDRDKEIKKLKNALSNLEKKVSEQEEALADIEKKLANPSEEGAKNQTDIFFKHADVQKKLDEYLLRWEKTGEELERLSEE